MCLKNHKKTTWILLIALFLAAWTSCNLEQYNVVVENGYFESLSQVSLGGTNMEKLEPGQRSRSYTFKVGRHLFQAHTESNLLVSSEINLQGPGRNVTVLVNTGGKVEVRF